MSMRADEAATAQLDTPYVGTVRANGGTAAPMIALPGYAPGSELREGALIRAQGRDEIFLIENGERRWIPDISTLLDRGNDLSEVTPLPAVIAWMIPLGTAVASVLPVSFPDGTLVMSGSGPAIYVIENGQRRWIPNPATFMARGYRFENVLVISDVELSAIPLGEPLPIVYQSLIYDTGLQDLNYNHYMHTRARLHPPTAHIDASTRTATFTWFGGYHGGVSILISDKDDIVIAKTPLVRFGVDGTVIGINDRTDAWQWDGDPAVTQNATGIRNLHTWAPDDFNTIMAKLGTGLRSVGEVVGAVASVAVLF